MRKKRPTIAVLALMAGVFVLVPGCTRDINEPVGSCKIGPTCLDYLDGPADEAKKNCEGRSSSHKGWSTKRCDRAKALGACYCKNTGNGQVDWIYPNQFQKTPIDARNVCADSCRFYDKDGKPWE